MHVYFMLFLKHKIFPIRATKRTCKQKRKRGYETHLYSITNGAWNNKLFHPHPVRDNC